MTVTEGVALAVIRQSLGMSGEGSEWYTFQAVLPVLCCYLVSILKRNAMNLFGFFT